MRKKKCYFIFFIFLIIFIYTIIMFFKPKEKTNEILNTIEITNQEWIEEDKNEQTERIIKVKELKEQYEDIVGWIEIEGTNINYPVVQYKDNDFYVTHNYKKEKTKRGSIFLDKDYDWSIPSNNLLIYGHNNRNDTAMFADLLKYKEESFYKQHSTIKFTTPQEDAEYEIISVFLSRVYYKKEKDVFRYYYFINAKNEQQYNEYIENAKKASLYDTGITAEYGEQLLTLSTCEYSQQDGRFVVVARKK